MITFTRGNIFDAQTDVILNPINAYGPMGPGLAKQFTDKLTALERAYKAAGTKARADGFTMLGLPWIMCVDPAIPGGGPWNFVVCLPTKDHWPDRSQWVWIEDGFRRLGRERGLFFTAHGKDLLVATPPLGVVWVACNGTR
jgi:hypothetical protein